MTHRRAFIDHLTIRVADLERRRLFVAGQTLTFPLWVYGAVKVGIPPQVFVMGTFIFAAGVAIALASVFAQRWRPVSRA